FNIGLAHDRLGEKAEAVRRYKAYLAQAPNAVNRAAVEQKVAALERELAAEEAAMAPQPQPPPQPQPAPPPEPTPAPPAPPAAEVAPAPPPAAPPAPRSARPAYAPTGDPELDRVARIDIQSIRDRYRGRSRPEAAPAP